MRSLRYAAALIVGLMLVVSGAARPANLSYKIQSIVTLGGMAGDVPLPKNGIFWLGGLSDDGQILFDVFTTTDRLILYAGEKFTPLAVAGGDGPSGKWPNNVGIGGPGPQSMNPSGDIVFAAVTFNGGLVGPALGTYFRDAKTQTVTAIALKKMPAVDKRTITDPGGFIPVINNRGEIALVASVSSPGTAGAGLLLREPDGSLQAVVLPNDPLPGGGNAHTDIQPQPSINDRGLVAFLTRAQTNQQDSAYVWENGTLAPVLVVGTDVPGAGKVHSVSSVLLNNKDRSLLVTAALDGGSNRHGLYRVSGGQVTPVLLPGQATPEGGTFRTVETLPGPNAETISLAVSAANAAGQHGFIAHLEDGTTAAYTLDPDGKLTLILKSGTVTDLGTITSLGSGSNGGNDIGLNAQGQMILIASIDGGPRSLLLLTPLSP